MEQAKKPGTIIEQDDQSFTIKDKEGNPKRVMKESFLNLGDEAFQGITSEGQKYGSPSMTAEMRQVEGETAKDLEYSESEAAKLHKEMQAKEAQEREEMAQRKMAAQEAKTDEEIGQQTTMLDPETGKMVEVPGEQERIHGTREQYAFDSGHGGLSEENAQAIKNKVGESQSAIGTAQKDYLKSINEMERAQIAEAQKNEELHQSMADQIDDMAEKSKVREEERQKKMDKVINDLDETFKQIEQKKIDPNRYWANKSTGQKIMMGLGTFLAGLGGGDNRVLQYVNKQIQNDIAAQKDQFDRQGQRAQNMYKVMLQRFGDERKAEAATEAMMIKSMQQRINAKVAGSKSATIRANAAKMKLDMNVRLAELAQKINKGSGFLPGGTRIRPEQIRDKETSQRYIPELQQLVSSADDAKQVKKVIKSKKKYDSLLDEAIEWRKKYGAEVLDRGAISEGKSIMAELALIAKSPEQYALGVLAGPDMDILDSVLGGSLDRMGWVLPKLMRLRKNSDVYYNQELSNYGLRQAGPQLDEKAN